MTIAPRDYPGIADEYVLGLLDAATAAEVDEQLKDDRDLSRAVAQARDRFLPLDTVVEPVGLTPSFWHAIEARVAGTAAASARPAMPRRDNVPSNDNVAGSWRRLAVASLAAVTMLGAGLVWSLTRTLDPVVIAVLVNEAGDVQAVVEDFANNTARVSLLSDFSVPADKTLQVWTLPSRDMGPKSLGLLKEAKSMTLSGSALPAPQDAQLYEITLEQAGGSPTGRPTGPILAKGFAHRSR